MGLVKKEYIDVIERREPLKAAQWHVNGDHPDDNTVFMGSDGKQFESEGKVVRRLNSPLVPGEELCKKCGHVSRRHGWIDVPLKGILVCPGDWIVTHDYDHLETSYTVLSEKEFNEQYVLTLNGRRTDLWDRLADVGNVGALAKWIFLELAHMEIDALMAQLWMMIRFGEDRYAAVSRLTKEELEAAVETKQEAIYCKGTP